VTHSPLTNEIRLSSQSSSRNGVVRDMVLWHHTASVSGRGEGVVMMMVNATREVSSNYVIGSDGYVWLVVDEDRRAWTSGSSSDGGKGAAFDRRSNTLECVNSTGAPSWLQSEAFYNIAARLAVDFYKRYGIPLDRDHHVGHRELYIRWGASYPTACPGGMDIDRILAMARSLLDPAAVEREKAIVRSVGTYLNTLSKAGLSAKYGVPGLLTGAASDGIPLDPGETYSKYYHLVQMWGREYRPDIYTTANDIDGIPGPTTRRVEQIIREMVAAGTAPGQKPPEPVVITEGGTVALTSAIPVYPSSTKAKAGTGSTATYQPGSYTVHKVYGQAVNITKTPGSPGGWVMADTLKVLTNEWLVTFDLNNKSEELFAVEIASGATVAQPAEPIYTGHEFNGWYASETAVLPFDFDSKITKDVTLTARWTQIVMHTVTFVTPDQSLSVQVRDGEKAPNPGDPPVSVGQVFEGWYGDDGIGLKWDFTEDVVTEDIVLTASFIDATVDPPDEPTDPVDPTDPVPLPKPEVPWFGILIGGIAAILAAVLAVVLGSQGG
jgi:uncharacterized repeat protein (TIGR02543 family)